MAVVGTHYPETSIAEPSQKGRESGGDGFGQTEHLVEDGLHDGVAVGGEVPRDRGVGLNRDRRHHERAAGGLAGGEIADPRLHAGSTLEAPRNSVGRPVTGLERGIEQPTVFGQPFVWGVEGVGHVADDRGTVRFYERRGIVAAPVRRPSGYREYTADVIDRITLARRLQGVGLSLDEIINALTVHDTGQATCASERWRLELALARVDARLAELKALRREIVKAANACASGRCGLNASPPPSPDRLTLCP